MGKNFKLHIRAAITVILLCGFINIPHASAQTKQKPELVPVVLNEKTNDPKALEIVRKLAPDFFVTGEESFKSGKNAKFFAKYAPLDKNNPKRFIIFTIADTPYWCTAHGCPYVIYENKSGSVWKTALELQVNKIWYDRNSSRQNVTNIITQNSLNQVAVWLWASGKFIKVERK